MRTIVTLAMIVASCLALLLPSPHPVVRRMPSQNHIRMNQAGWTDALISELEDAATLAARGGTVSDVLHKAREAAIAGAQAAREADAKMSSKLRAAEQRASRALVERDAAVRQAARAEAARTTAADALTEMEQALAKAEGALERTKQEAALALGKLEDAHEFEQDRVRAMRMEIEEQKRALKKAEQEARRAAARQATSSADVASLKRERTEMEKMLEEERLVLEGCLLESQNERDALQSGLHEAHKEREALLCRALVAEARIGRKRRAVRNLVSTSASSVRKLGSRLAAGTASFGRQAEPPTRSAPKAVGGISSPFWAAATRAKAS